MNRKKEACHCKNVTYGAIADAVAAGCTTFEAVQEKLKFGTGCGKCREFIAYLIGDLVREQEAAK